MSLCHDERDFAMGFSRHDPHAPRHRTPGEIQSAEARKNYLENLLPQEKEAYKRVRLCLQSAGRHIHDKGEAPHIPTHHLHEHFPAFAKRMGFAGKVYEKVNGICPAVEIAFPTRPGSIWFLMPDSDYAEMSRADREKLLTEEVLQAGLEFCKEWLPNWQWKEK